MHRRAALSLTTAAVLTGTAAAVVVIPALAAGSADPAPSVTATAQTVRNTANALSPEQAAVLNDPQVAVDTDPDKAKAAAIEAGRPEAAWDKNCIAWDLPTADTRGQQFANAVAERWLATYTADCPDAIKWPAYYAETFTAGGPGEVVVTLDDQAIADYHIEPHSDRHLQMFGFDVWSRAVSEYPELEAVTVTVKGTDRVWTVTPEQVDGGVLTAPYDPSLSG